MINLDGTEMTGLVDTLVESRSDSVLCERLGSLPSIYVKALSKFLIICSLNEWNPVGMSVKRKKTFIAFKYGSFLFTKEFDNLGTLANVKL